MNDFAFPVEIVRTDRTKSASIHVERDVVKVRVPKKLSNDRIKELVGKRTAWINGKLREHALRPVVKPKEYVSGETFSYLGRNYRLKVIRGSDTSLKMKSGYLWAMIHDKDANPESTIRSLLQSWYQRNARIRLSEKTERLARIVGVNPSSISIKDYKARWGSCSVNGDVAYNWRIIMAPHRIVDYVVIHELCHLLEHNHSPRFWKQVQRHVTDWRECKEWLRTNNPSFD